MKKLLTTLAIIPVIAFGQSSATFKNITVKGALKLDDSTVTSVTSGSILATKEYGEATYFNPDSSMQKLTVDTIIIGNDSLFVCPNGVLAYTGSMAVKDTLNASLLNVGDEDSCTINRPNANRGSYFDDYVTIRNKGADELMIVFRNASLASGKMLGLNGHSEGYCWVSVDPITFNVIDKIQCFYLKDNDNSTTLGGQANRSNTIGRNGGKSEVSVGGSKTNINNFKIAQPAASTGNNLVVQEQDGSTVGDTALIIDSEQKVRIYQSLVLPDGFELIDSSQLGGTVNVGDSIAMAADTAYFIEWDSIGNKPILLDSTEIMDSINSYTPLYADTAYHYTIDSTTGIDLVEPDSIEYMLVVGDNGKPRKAQAVLNENFDVEYKSVTAPNVFADTLNFNDSVKIVYNNSTKNEIAFVIGDDRAHLNFKKSNLYGILSSPASTTTTAIDTYYFIQGTFDNKFIVDFGADGDTIQYNGASGTLFDGVFKGNVTSGTNNTDLEFGVFIQDTLCMGCGSGIVNIISAGDYSSVTIPFKLELSNLDKVKLQVKSNKAGASITFNTITAILTEIGRIE